MLITNAKIYTMNDRSDIIENGFLQVENGRISSVGSMENAPRDEEVALDAGGRMIFPGFVDAHSHIGMWEDSLDFEGSDGNEETDPCTPQLRAIDAINPIDRAFSEALSAGVTTVMTGPGSANAIAGQSAAVKTAGRCIDDMIIAAPAAIKFALGENPKKVYSDKERTPSTRMATAAIIREQLFEAQRYLKELENSDEDELPDYDFKCEALLPLLRREIPAHFHAHRTDDIFTAIRIAREFSLRVCIVHGTSAYLDAERIAIEKVPVLCGPILCDRSKPELSDLNTAAAGVLEKAGIEPAIITDHPVVPEQYLALSAAVAVKNGMTEMGALRAITINPAKYCGISHRVGSLEEGKDADFSIFSEWPLALCSVPDSVYVSGKLCFSPSEKS